LPVIGDGQGIWSFVHVDDVGRHDAGARRASNAKAKRELDWQPRYRSWRQGFREALGRPKA